jgi:hypothetical protein
MKQTTKSKPTSPEDEHAALSWKLIEWKVAYYRPEKVHPSRRKDYEVSDADYDKASHRYMVLCRELKRPNTIVHDTGVEFEDVPDLSMMEIDENRPSVQRVLRKLGSPKPKRKTR